MRPDRVSNPEPLALESDALPTVLLRFKKQEGLEALNRSPE